MRERLEFRDARWALLLFLATSGFEVPHAIGTPWAVDVAGPGKDAVYDLFLEHLPSSHPTETLRRLLEVIPPADAVVVVGREGDQTFLRHYQMISLLAYPRPVGALGCAPSGRHSSVRTRLAPRWAIFSGVHEPRAGVAELIRQHGLPLRLERLEPGIGISRYCGEAGR